MPALHRAELEREVTEALHLSGVSGTVRLRADGLELQNPLGAARVALDGPRELDEFRDAAPSERRRRARELAGLLAEARTTRRAAGASHKSHSGFRVSMRSALAITVANLGLSTFFLVRIADRPEPVASGPSATATATASAPRDSASDARACGLALTKLRAGEVPKREEALGFVAELWLATPEPSPRAAVEGALPQVKGELGDDAGADIEVVDATLDARKLPGAIVRLRGASAALAFDPSGSARLGRMADALAGATHAELAALTLRCAHRTASPLGLWFRGARDGASVAAALLVGMGRAPKGDAADASALYPALRERLAIALEGGKLKEFVLSRGGDLPSTRPPPVVVFRLGGAHRAAQVADDIVAALEAAAGDAGAPEPTDAGEDRPPGLVPGVAPSATTPTTPPSATPTAPPTTKPPSRDGGLGPGTVPKPEPVYPD